MNRALVTGASAGIGVEFAKQLAADGWSVTAVARSERKLVELVAALPNGPHAYVVADLSLASGVETVAATLRTQKHALLVNNAGVASYGRFQHTPLDKTRAMMRLNMDALVDLCHAFLENAQRGDAILNVASALGYLAYPGASAYAATKAFVINFSEGLWHEEKERGVYVMALCPGVTKTGFHETAGGFGNDHPPDAISQEPAAVVKEALHALKARKHASVTTGPMNLMVFGARFLSRNALVNMMGRFGPHDEHADHHGAAAKATTGAA